MENGDTRDDANLSPDLQKEKNGGDCSEKIDDVSGGVPVLTRTLPDGEICGGSKVNEDTPFTESKKNDSALKNKSVRVFYLFIFYFNFIFFMFMTWVFCS